MLSFQKLTSTQTGQHFLDEIRLADRDAAGGDDRVGDLRRLAERRFKRRRLVGNDAHVDDVGAEPSEQAMQRVAIAVIYLARRQGLADRGQFVAGREEGDAQAAPDLDLGDAERGDQPQFGRTDPLAGRQCHGAACQILAGAPRVLALPLAGGNDYRSFLDPRHFLHHHGIRPRRQHGAGHDAHRLSLADQAGK